MCTVVRKSYSVSLDGFDTVEHDGGDQKRML